jgi:hypothetical protein
MTLPTDPGHGPLPAPYSTMSPPDAVVTLRSLPRRWRGLFGDVEDDSDVGELASRRPSAGARSALEHLVHTASALEAAARHIRLVRATDRPSLDGPPQPGRSGDEASLPRALDQLDAAARSAAKEVESVPGTAWSRTGERSGRSVDLLTLTRETVRTGVEGLHAAEAALRQARAQED